jgi:hypothetical protein
MYLVGPYIDCANCQAMSPPCVAAMSVSGGTMPPCARSARGVKRSDAPSPPAHAIHAVAMVARTSGPTRSVCRWSTIELLAASLMWPYHVPPGRCGQGHPGPLSPGDYASPRHRGGGRTVVHASPRPFPAALRLQVADRAPNACACAPCAGAPCHCSSPAGRSGVGRRC